MASEPAASSICTQRLRCLFCPDGRKSHFSIPAGILVSSGLSWLEALTEGFHLCLEDGTEIKAVLLLPEEPVPILNPFSAIKPARPKQPQQITASSAEWGGEGKPFLSWS